LGLIPKPPIPFINGDGSTTLIRYEEVTKIEEISNSTNSPAEERIESSPPTLDEQKDKLKIEGSVDMYYQYNLNEQPLLTSFTERHNTFTLGMANVILSESFKKVGFTADIAIGPRAESANGHNGTTLSAIKQLFIFYQPIDQMTLTAGNFSTFVGYELIDPDDNIHYSTSYLFSNGPFFHTGVKLDYNISESFAFMLGLFNDTDSKFDENQGKHFGTQLAFTKPTVSIFLNYLTGMDSDIPGERIRGHQIDLTAMKDLSDQFSLGLNISRKFNQQEDSPDTAWFGTALYAKYQLKESLIFGLRGEYMNDPDGIIIANNSGGIYSFTFSSNIKYHGFIYIPEIRIDHSSNTIFPSGENGTSNYSPALLMAVIYAF